MWLFLASGLIFYLQPSENGWVEINYQRNKKKQQNKIAWKLWLDHERCK